ncbi:MAG: bifunctional enoyl-CoA hydratase/phosphate acetyltransferase [Armatimonadota bacterium]
MITRLDEILDAVADHPVRRVAVAAAESESVLAAVKDAREKEVATPVLVGDEREVCSMAERVGLDLADVPLVDEPDEVKAALRACDEVREGRADVVMKGHIHTDDVLRAVLDREHGLRSGHIMSHVFIMETTDLGRLTLVTDGAMNIAPDLVTKADIVLNAVYLARLLGVERPKVCVLAAVELVNPAMPATLDAAALGKMGDRGQFPYCQIDGPFALDNAVSEAAARVKRIDSPVAGLGDILLVPDIEAGNMLVKCFSFLGRGRVAGVVVGAAAPVVLTSRADTAESKMYSIATAVFMANLRRDRRLKIGKVHY